MHALLCVSVGAFLALRNSFRRRPCLPQFRVLCACLVAKRTGLSLSALRWPGLSFGVSYARFFDDPVLYVLSSTAGFTEVTVTTSSERVQYCTCVEKFVETLLEPIPSRIFCCYKRGYCRRGESNRQESSNSRLSSIESLRQFYTTYSTVCMCSTCVLYGTV